MEIIFSRILSVPIGGPPNGILVAPNKFVIGFEMCFRIGLTNHELFLRIISIEMGCLVLQELTSFYKRRQVSIKLSKYILNIQVVLVEQN